MGPLHPLSLSQVLPSWDSFSQSTRWTDLHARRARRQGYGEAGALSGTVPDPPSILTGPSPGSSALRGVVVPMARLVTVPDLLEAKL